MKKPILLFCFSFFYFISYSQITAEVLDETNFEDLDLNVVEDLIVHINITNTSSDTLRLKWEVRRSGSMCQDEWGFSICDNINCYTEFIHSNVDPEFPINIPSVMSPNESYNMELHVLPKMFSGCCDVTIDFSLVEAIDDIILSVDVPIQINDVNCITSSYDVLVPNLILYPNPFSDIIKLENGEEIYSAKVFDINGKLVNTQRVKNNNIQNLNYLNPGMYLITLYNDNNRVMKTIRLSKN